MNVYEIVTKQILEKLQQGIIPWKKAWRSHTNLAYNRVTRKKYSFLNQMILKHTGEYASFKQWQQLGGKVKKGEKGEQVVFWTFLYKDENGNTINPKKATREELEKCTRIPILKYYTVFHISQVEGVETCEEQIVLDKFSEISNAEELKQQYLTRENIPLIENETTEAAYSPGKDQISVPIGGRFDDNEEYYSTLFHEIIHSTGHEKRLGRLKKALFGSKTYAKEELVAEMGSAMILNQLGIDTESTLTNSTAYIQNWMSVISEDPKLVVTAASKAEKAVDFVLTGKK